MSLHSIYNELLVAASNSASANDTSLLSKAIVLNEMQECGAEDDRFISFNQAHELVSGSERLLIQYRYYDTSKVFSIRPDMNVYLIKLMRGNEIIAEKEIKFLDSGPY